MVEESLSVLPDGEFYLFDAERGGSLMLDEQHRPYDSDPRASDALRQRCHARWLEMDPDWRLGQDTPMGRERTRTSFLPLELLPRSAAFRTDAPPALPHFSVVDGYGYDPVAGFADLAVFTVSAAWKDAIESLEPGVHQFAPFELRFEDKVVTDCYLFRNMQYFDLIDYGNSDTVTVKTSRGPVVSILEICPRFVAAKRDVVSGHHWMQHRENPTPYPAPFVSRSLAVLLHALMPTGGFLPVTLT